jgi:hypothetical protein
MATASTLHWEREMARTLVRNLKALGVTELPDVHLLSEQMAGQPLPDETPADFDDLRMLLLVKDLWDADPHEAVLEQLQQVTASLRLDLLRREGQL